MDNDISNQRSDSDSLVMNFKDKVESALQTFVKMSPSEKAEASILWNITSEKLQEIINNSANAMKDVSFIVIKSSSNSMKSVNDSNTFIEGERRTFADLSVDDDNSTIRDSEPIILSSKKTIVNDGNGRYKQRTTKTRKGKEIESRLRKFLKETENSQLISKSKTTLQVNSNNKNKSLSSRKKCVLKISDKHTEEQTSSLSTTATVVVGIEEGDQEVNNSSTKLSNSNSSLSSDKEKSNHTRSTTNCSDSDSILMNEDGSHSKNTTETKNSDLNIVIQPCRKTNQQQSEPEELESREDTNYIEEISLNSPFSSSPSQSTLLKRKSRNINNNRCSTSRFIKKVQVVEKNRWTCENCEKQFDDYLTLQYHISCEHSTVKAKQFQCTSCQATFSTKSNLNVHLRRHSGERPFNCKMPKCSVTFTTSNNLRRHILSHHQNLKPYRCSICDSSFSEKRSLQVHLRRHSGERPFSCSECGKNFTQKKVLRNHMSTHSTEKIFLCTQCGRSFKLKTHLRAHEIRHQGDRTHACRYCKASFFSKSDLNRHEQSHGEEKPFTCKEANCSKKFMRNQSLKEHIKRNHGIKLG